MGFNYDVFWNRRKAAEAHHSGESAWACSEQAAVLFRKLTACDVCAAFDTKHRAAVGSDFDHHRDHDIDADAHKHWSFNHGHGHD